VNNDWGEWRLQESASGLNVSAVTKGQNCVIEHKDDKKDFKALISAIEILGFTKLEQDTIFRMLASVLHIGNIYFLRKQVSSCY